MEWSILSLKYPKEGRIIERVKIEEEHLELLSRGIIG